MNHTRNNLRMPIKLLVLMILMGMLSTSMHAQKKKKRKKGETTAIKPKTPPKEKSNIKPYKEIITDKAISDRGLFVTHQVKSKHYFEIPDSVLNKDMIIVSRRAAMSGSEIDRGVVGERVKAGLMVRWTKAPGGEHVFLKKVTSRNWLRYNGNDKAFKKAIDLQTLDPILIAFPIKAIGKDSLSSVIEIGDLFLANIEELTPFGSGGWAEAFGLVPPKKYILKEDRSFIESTTSFDRNIEVRSLLTYTQKEKTHTNIFSVLMHRSMVLLPDIPMSPRLADERIGHFTQPFFEYNENQPVFTNYYIKRWRLEPKEEDLEKAKRGELVEPKKKIIFYIDSTTPEKWRTYIKQGVEDWLPAFEEAGFKNAIEARDIPLDSVEFHPEDIRHSVIRYVASNISNAKGPSVIDPRSGEILESDIIVYHNIIKTIRDWRFAQTAANDSKVRTTDISDEILGEGLRYVIAHEVGHSLGLRHNMGASAAFPVDSLRSPTFTQKYGTTPSIMDYARFNYVAQPEDVGVKLIPPQLGAYDGYAIRWGYKAIYDVADEYEEVATLSKWIEEKNDDPIYYFGEGDLSGSDPGSQKESLGDDVVKASEYGVKNAQFIIDHLDDWLSQEGEKYGKIEDFYQAVLRQYNRYISHVGKVVAGVYLRRPLQGQEQKMYEYVPKEKQREAVQFLIDQFKEFPKWIENEELSSKLTLIEKRGSVRRIVTPSQYIEGWYRRSLISTLVNDGKLMLLIDNEVSNGAGAYTAVNLLNDIRVGFFAKTVKGKKLDYYEQLIQQVYVDWLLRTPHFKSMIDFKPTAFVDENVIGQLGEEYFCGHVDFSSNHDDFNERGKENLHFQYLKVSRNDKKDKISAVILDEVKKIKKMVLRYRNTTNDIGTKSHYDLLLRKIAVYLE